MSEKKLLTLFSGLEHRLQDWEISQRVRIWAVMSKCIYLWYMLNVHFSSWIRGKHNSFALLFSQ